MRLTKSTFMLWVGMLLCLIPGPRSFAKDLARERQAVAAVIDASIGWFKNKDFELLFRVFSPSPDLFLFQPTSTTTIVGGDAFRKFAEVWKNPHLAYERHEIRDLRIDFSPHRDVAWFSALLDDCARSGEKTGCWKDTRWTGVLLKRKAGWEVIQMHFSFAADQVAAAKKAGPEASRQE